MYSLSLYSIADTLLWAISLLICCCQLCPACLGKQSSPSLETGVLPLASGFARNHCPWLLKAMKPRWEKHLLHLHVPKASLTSGEDRDEKKRKQGSAGPGPTRLVQPSLKPPESKASHGLMGAVFRSSGSRVKPFKILKLWNVFEPTQNQGLYIAGFYPSYIHSVRVEGTWIESLFVLVLRERKPWV